MNGIGSSRKTYKHIEMKQQLRSLLLLSVILFPACDKTENEAWLTDVFLSPVEDREVKGADYAAVDLGLSVKWADCNVGALKSWKDSRYFAWGETAEKSSYTWVNYQYINAGNSSLSKYNSTDGLWILQSKDDPATSEMGAGWRLPTADEMVELLDNCDWSISSKSGTKIITATSKKNGASIVFQLTGYKDGKTLEDMEVDGYLWSSELTEDESSQAYFLHLNTRDNKVSIGAADRRFGLCVRGVRK